MTQTKYQNKVRIIGGEWRGRRIEFASVPGLRPTKDLIRETLFNWLAPSIETSRCLDLFAGSGVLGFEAASRGAAEVVLVESNHLVVSCLEKQKQVLGAEQVKINEQSAQSYLQTQKKQFDIIFLDPPFANDWLPEMLVEIKQQHLLTAQGLVYIETAKSRAGKESLLAGWSVVKSKITGAVLYALLGLPD